MSACLYFQCLECVSYPLMSSACTFFASISPSLPYPVTSISGPASEIPLFSPGSDPLTPEAPALLRGAVYNNLEESPQRPVVLAVDLGGAQLGASPACRRGLDDWPRRQAMVEERLERAGRARPFTSVVTVVSNVVSRVLEMGKQYKERGSMREVWDCSGTWVLRSISSF